MGVVSVVSSVVEDRGMRNVATTPRTRKPAAREDPRTSPWVIASRAASATATVSGFSLSGAMTAPALSVTVEENSCARSLSIPPSVRVDRRLELIVEKKTVVSAAMPRADPSWRKVLWMAEPCPPSFSGTSSRTTLVTWAVANPTPTP